MTLAAAPDSLVLTDDDRVLLHAVAMAGDAVREADLNYLLSRWPWAAPMEWDRLQELASAGLLAQTDDGWFVPLAVDVAASAALPRALDPLLRGFVGEMLCRGADSIERFQLGFRRMIAGGREHALVSVSRAWGQSPAGRAGPRAEAFVAALGARRLGPALASLLMDAVPDLAPERSIWRAPLRMVATAASALILLEVVQRAK
jgi:hypothetical protein